MRTVDTIGESNARIAQLRAQGFRVKIIKGPWGRIVLRSRKAFVCNAHHYCAWKSVKPLPFVKRPATKRRKRAATKTSRPVRRRRRARKAK